MKQTDKSNDAARSPVVTSGVGIALSRRSRTPKDYLALAIATCGVGYLPIAPGTWGSAVGVGLYLLLRWATLRFVWPGAGADRFLRLDRGIVFLPLELVVITLVTLIGIWAASRVERLEGKKDPGKVVIDEVAGQLIALLPIPLSFGAGLPWVIIGFFLFRAFDIVKPFPIHQLEALPSGTGIVVDDLGAGAYAALVLSILIALWMIF